MTTKKLFQKRKSKYSNILLIIIFFILIMLFYYFFLKKSKEFIIIPENKDIFYIIPDNRGGEIVENLNKKSLNLISKEINNTLTNPEDLLFSIQFYSNSEYEKVNNYILKIINNDENIYQLEDFFILSINTEIGIDYFLVYKNFETRKDAENYCLKFLTKIDNCLIVDTTKF